MIMNLLPRLASLVNSEGVLAVQMPSNFDQPSHRLMEETAFNGPWSERLPRDWKQLFASPARVVPTCSNACRFPVDAWRTTYYFLLQGEDPVLRMGKKGTSLQPIMSRLNGEEWEAFPVDTPQDYIIGLPGQQRPERRSRLREYSSLLSAADFPSCLISLAV